MCHLHKTAVNVRDQCADFGGRSAIGAGKANLDISFCRVSALMEAGSHSVHKDFLKASPLRHNSSSLLVCSNQSSVINGTANIVTHKQVIGSRLCGR